MFYKGQKVQLLTLATAKVLLDVTSAALAPVNIKKPQVKVAKIKATVKRTATWGSGTVKYECI